MMGALTMEQARLAGVEKFVGVGTICAYPKLAPVPFLERDLWNGYPEETNAPYGIAKKMLLVQGQAYRQEYGFNAIHLLPVNLYGPHDNFDPASSHVIPALIRKCLEAIDARLGRGRLLGDGQRDARVPLRRGLRRSDRPGGGAVRRARAGQLGAGFEISIRDLAELDRGADGLQGTADLRSHQARRPAAAKPRRDPRAQLVRFRRHDRFPDRA